MDEIIVALRALAQELADLLDVEGNEYPPDAAARVRMIERELSSLLGRCKALASPKSLSL